MLQLTKRTEYGLIALIHLVDRVGEVVSVREIGDSYPVPRRLLAEVLKDLHRAGLVDSQRGATGGYRLARAADDVTLGEIVQALEGAPALTSCEGMPAAKATPAKNHTGHHQDCVIEHVCPIRSPLQRIRQGIWTLLERTTLRSLAESSLNPQALFTAALSDGA